MTTPQHKIGSGFGMRSTAAQVLAGIDLTSKLAIVTGEEAATPDQAAVLAGSAVTRSPARADIFSRTAV